MIGSIAAMFLSRVRQIEGEYNPKEVLETLTEDFQNLYNPRVDSGEVESTSYYAFDPIGGGVTEFGSSTMGLDIKGEVGELKVSTE